jgi:hypothetical protein
VETCHKSACPLIRVQGYYCPLAPLGLKPFQPQASDEAGSGGGALRMHSPPANQPVSVCIHDQSKGRRWEHKSGGASVMEPPGVVSGHGLGIGIGIRIRVHVHRTCHSSPPPHGHTAARRCSARRSPQSPGLGSDRQPRHRTRHSTPHHHRPSPHHTPIRH